MKTLDTVEVLGTYTIENISCSDDDAEKLQRLGIFVGEEIILVKNHKKDTSLVIENMDANFVIDKQIAKGIKVKYK